MLGLSARKRRWEVVVEIDSPPPKQARVALPLQSNAKTDSDTGDAQDGSRGRRRASKQRQTDVGHSRAVDNECDADNTRADLMEMDCTPTHTSSLPDSSSPLLRPSIFLLFPSSIRSSLSPHPPIKPSPTSIPEPSLAVRASSPRKPLAPLAQVAFSAPQRQNHIKTSLWTSSSQASGGSRSPEDPDADVECGRDAKVEEMRRLLTTLLPDQAVPRTKNRKRVEDDDEDMAW